MNAEERNLIAGLFERLRGAEAAYRDPDADAFINDQVARQPHAPYAMAQTLIVQNQALEAAQARIAELEGQVEAAGRGAPEAGSPWGPRAGAAMGAPAGFGAGGGREAASQQPAYGQQNFGQQGYGAPQQQASRGGGFLSGALATAAGVAGGALLFSGLSSMFGGDEAKAATPEAAEPAKAAETETADAAPDAAPEADGGGGWFSGLLGGNDAGGGAEDAGGGDEDWA